MIKTNFLKKKASKVRKTILEMLYKSREPHIGSCLSCVEILTALYFDILKIDKKNPLAEGRNRFILSKGHAVPALYAILAEAGLISARDLSLFTTNGSSLAAHPVLGVLNAIEVSTGSLGHGLALGAGMALVAKHDHKDYRVFVLLGDGECDEGAIWETALFASHHRLNNLVAIIDNNKIQGFGRTAQVLNLEPLLVKWQAFGWGGKNIDGHNFPALLKALKDIPCVKGKPTVLVAATVKGKGVSFMENTLLWHYQTLDSQKFNQAIKEINK